MNRLFTASLSTTLLYLLLTQPSFANRPGMDQSGIGQFGIKNKPVETSSNTEQAATNTQQQTPSSVELIMQQENHQTGNIIALPAKEMQAGETIRVKLLDSPRRGMSMSKVKNEYGQPTTASASVGEPPITRWIYNDRVVYFEYSTVIHVVAR